MTVLVGNHQGTLFADKEALRVAVEDQNRVMDLPEVPDASPERARQMMRDQGVMPEENLFSRGIIAAREGR
jgi:hypothetical protein